MAIGVKMAAMFEFQGGLGGLGDKCILPNTAATYVEKEGKHEEID